MIIKRYGINKQTEHFCIDFAQHWHYKLKAYLTTSVASSHFQTYQYPELSYKTALFEDLHKIGVRYVRLQSNIHRYPGLVGIFVQQYRWFIKHMLSKDNPIFDKATNQAICVNLSSQRKTTIHPIAVTFYLFGSLELIVVIIQDWVTKDLTPFTLTS